MVVPRPKRLFEDEITHLRGLDVNGLRSRWLSVFQRPAPAHLTWHLLFAVIARSRSLNPAGSGSNGCEGSRTGNVGPSGQLRSEANRACSRYGLGPGVGPTVAAGDGDG